MIMIFIIIIIATVMGKYGWLTEIHLTFKLLGHEAFIGHQNNAEISQRRAAA